MKRTAPRAVMLAAVMAAEITGRARGMDLPGVLPAALDQPQINAAIYVGNNALPQVGITTDPTDPFGTGGATTPFFNVPAYLDTGASSILLATSTATALKLPLAFVGSTPVIYSDVGVAGSDNYQVSEVLRLDLANFYPRTDLDQFSDPTQTIPVVTPYKPLAAYPNVRVEVGPYVPPVTDPGLDEIDQLINELSSGAGSVDVIGMPAIRGRVMVMDTASVGQVGSLFGILGDILSGTADINSLTDAQLNELQQAGMHTYLYAPGTPFHTGTATTDPGIPATQLHVKLSYASFDRFTSVTPAGQAGPTLEHNPIIGMDPVKLMDGIPQPHTPGIKISRVINGQIVSSEGNWLLDTGAAASIISKAQAAALGVSYQTGTFGTDSPILVDQGGAVLPDQFTLAIAGVGGQETLAGFYLDSLLVRTMEGSAMVDSHPNNLHFTHAPVLVGDITVKDPVTGQTLTLDGVFGMNYLVQSIDIALDPTGGISNLSDPSPIYFKWVTFDEPNGILGLALDSATAPAATAAVWKGGKGNWTTSAKWSTSPAYPDNIVSQATTAAYDVTIKNGTVTLDLAATINNLTLSGGKLTGTQNLTLSGGTIGGTYNVLGTTTLEGGTLAFNAGKHTAGTFTGDGTMMVGSKATMTSKGITLDSLEIDGKVTITSGISSAGTSKVDSLTIAGNGTSFTGRLNLKDNRLVVEADDDADKAAKMTALLAEVEAGSKQKWHGNGITSSTAAANPVNLAVQVFDNAAVGLTDFGGVEVDAESLLVEVVPVGALTPTMVLTKAGGTHQAVRAEESGGMPGTFATFQFGAPVTVPEAGTLGALALGAGILGMRRKPQVR